MSGVKEKTIFGLSQTKTNSLRHCCMLKKELRESEHQPNCYQQHADDKGSHENSKQDIIYKISNDKIRDQNFIEIVNLQNLAQEGKKKTHIKDDKEHFPWTSLLDKRKTILECFSKKSKDWPIFLVQKIANSHKNHATLEIGDKEIDHNKD